jgi:CDGSH-type Zn-finger protein
MADVTIQVLDNGPVLVSGSFEIQDGSGNTFTVDASRPAAICRCGHSENKPFCDGAHKTCGFSSSVKAS